MTITHQPHKPRLRLITVITVLAVVAAAIIYVMLQIPKHRTTFLVDTSATTTLDTGADSNFSAVSAAVGSAAQNTGDSDALSLRRFGGACGDPDNTAQIVDSGTGRSQQISDAVNTLTPGGEATLQSGILAAIDDFSSFYPFRGRESNRIVVVTSHGTDACTHDQATLTKTIHDRIAAAGLQLEFRFVGYKVPTDQQDTLAQVAAATGAPEPRFVQTAANLTATFKQLTIPESPDAAPIQIPSTSTAVPPPTTVSSSPREPVVTTSAEAPPALSDGQDFAYIESVDSPNRMIIVDKIEFLVGEEANAAAGDDNFLNCAQPDEPPIACNGYHIRNTNPRTYELQLSADATIMTNTLSGEYSADLSRDVPVTLEELAGLLSRRQNEMINFPFALIVSRGQIISLQEIFVP